MPDESKPDDRRPVARLLRDVYALLEAALEADLSPLGATPAQYGVMRRIQEQPGASSAQLARRVQVSAQNMHVLVGTLETKGWVRRTPHPELGQVRRVHLTEAGTELMHRCNAHALALADRLLAGFTDPEADQFAALLRRAEYNLQPPQP